MLFSLASLAFRTRYAEVTLEVVGFPLKPLWSPPAGVLQSSRYVRGTSEMGTTVLHVLLKYARTTNQGFTSGTFIVFDHTPGHEGAILDGVKLFERRTVALTLLYLRFVEGPVNISSHVLAFVGT